MQKIMACESGGRGGGGDEEHVHDTMKSVPKEKLMHGCLDHFKCHRRVGFSGDTASYGPPRALYRRQHLTPC
ncbi:hypothetical protein E2C01_010991 [Portunus trituberculatus]|uniref:Uncharacterized protein n=1 Tax=Portunus trituberculatus TaxID=210409 RepID=A0A5B7DAC4_PORTR|nr:hypothetical protein [Portunus trituberculatus]